MEGERIEPTEPVRDMSTGELIGFITERTRELVRDEIELAKSEARSDVRAEVRAAIGMTAGGVLMICGLTMCFVAVALALSTVIMPWAAALIVAGVVLVCGGIILMVGKKRIVRAPLARTRESIKENVEWASGRTHH
jgi:membrane protein